MSRDEWMEAYLESQGMKPDGRAARIARRAGEFMWKVARREERERQRRKAKGEIAKAGPR